MSANTAPSAQRVKVQEVATGRVFEAWPVDAREIVNHPNGDHVYAPTGSEVSAGTSAPPAEPKPPVVPLTIAEQLTEWSYKDVQVLAKRAGIKSVGKTKVDLIALLVPHVEGGTVSLEQLPKLAIDPVQFPHAAVV